jgi:hypothetical protein
MSLTPEQLRAEVRKTRKKAAENPHLTPEQRLHLWKCTAVLNRMAARKEQKQQAKTPRS